MYKYFYVVLNILFEIHLNEVKRSV